METVCVPLVDFEPDQSIDATQEVALEDVHDKLTELPLVIVIGPSELFALIFTTGGIEQDCVSNGLPAEDPHPFQSSHVLV